MTRVKATAATILALVALALAGSSTLATQPDPEHKVAICHRTASDTNPYVYIEVDDASLSPGHLDNADPGHKPTFWKSDGVFRGVAHLEGDAKDDYLATSQEDCDDFTPEATPTPSAEPSVEPSVEPSTEPSVAPTPEQSLIPPVVVDVPDTAIDWGETNVNFLVFLGAILLALAVGALAYRALVLYRLR